MDPRMPALPLILLGLFIAYYDPILGLIVLLLGLLVFLSAYDPSHSTIAMYFLLPLIMFLFFVRAFRDELGYVYRAYVLFAFVLVSLAIAAAAGHDYNGLLFSPMFIIPIALALYVDPSGKMAIVAVVLSYVPYSLLVMYLVRSVKNVKKHPLIGKRGIVVEEVTRQGGKIKIGNTYRDAITYRRLPLKPGTRVIVVDVLEGTLTLVVDPE